MKLMACTVLAAFALAGCADNSPGGKAAHARHKNMEALGKASKGIADELKKPTPDLAALRENIGKVHQLAPMLESWFAPGSGPQDGVKTDAKATAWTDQAGFHQAAAKLVNASDQLKGAADRNDLNAIRGAVQTLGGACKGCHDKYREKD